jgi:DNA-binding XRE family transcriptional regulator
MLTEDRSAQGGLTDPGARAFVESVKRLSPGDFDELLELCRHLRKADDQEEYDSWGRAIVELLEPRRGEPEPFPLKDEPMPAGLKKWAEHAGGKIKELRLKAGMTQAELAQTAGLTQSHISRLENAEHSPTHFTLAKIAGALGIDVGELDPCDDWTS